MWAWREKCNSYSQQPHCYHDMDTGIFNSHHPVHPGGQPTVASPRPSPVPPVTPPTAEEGRGKPIRCYCRPQGVETQATCTETHYNQGGVSQFVGYIVHHCNHLKGG